VGQKVHPYGFRLGYNKTWRSRWFADAGYAKLLHEDLRLRKELKRRLSHAGVAEIDIERTANKIRVNIFSARPGIIIGRKGAEVDKLGAELRAVYGQDIHINIQEIQRPEIEAQLIAESIASQLVRRITFRRAMRRAMENLCLPSRVPVCIAGRRVRRAVRAGKTCNSLWGPNTPNARDIAPVCVAGRSLSTATLSPTE
jgi:small subunit ribosomal protein S3